MEMISNLKWLKYTKNVDEWHKTLNKLKSNFRLIRHGKHVKINCFSALLGVINIGLETQEFIQTGQKINQIIALTKALQYDVMLADIEELELIPNSDPAFKNALLEIKESILETPEDSFIKLFNEVNNEIKNSKISQTLNVLSIGKEITGLYSLAVKNIAVFKVYGWLFAAVFTVKTLHLIQQHNDFLKDAMISTTLYEFYYRGYKDSPVYDELKNIKFGYLEYSYWVNLHGAYSNGYYDFLKDINSDWNYWLNLIESSKNESLGRVKNSLIGIIEQKFGSLEDVDIQQNQILNIVIFDNSGSMGERSAFSNKTKIDEAKIALAEVVQNSSDNFDWTLLNFNGCNVRETISNSPNKEEILNEVNRLQPFGQTPIGYSLQHALELFKDNSDYEKVSIILITDGLETCSEGLPERVAREIRNYVEIEEELISFNGILYTDAYASSKLPPLILFIVGFTTNESENISLQNIAQIAGGKLYTAANLPELKESLQKIVDSIEGKNVFLWTLIPIFIVIIFIAGLILFVFVRRPESAVIGNKEITASNYYQLYDELKGQPVYVNKKHFKIGRLPSNDLVLNEKTISKVHAEIFYNKDLGQFIIKNHSVVNPIYVNDKKASKVLLKNNDVIKIARYKFRFIRDEVG